MEAILNIFGTIASAVVSAPGVMVANPIQSAAVAAITAVVGIVAKKADNDVIEKLIQSVIGMPCYAAGLAVTFGLSKWPYTARWWNRYIEAYVIDLINHLVNIPIVAADNFVRGMKSDNKLKRSKD